MTLYSLRRIYSYIISSGALLHFALNWIIIEHITIIFKVNEIPRDFLAIFIFAWIILLKLKEHYLDEFDSMTDMIANVLGVLAGLVSGGLVFRLIEKLL